MILLLNSKIRFWAWESHLNGCIDSNSRRSLIRNSTSDVIRCHSSTQVLGVPQAADRGETQGWRVGRLSQDHFEYDSPTNESVHCFLYM